MTASEPQARVQVLARIGTERPEDAQDRVARPATMSDLTDSASAIPRADHHGRGLLLE